MQAVMASDFALSRFKFIERLLLVHGHWCYDRLARMILYFFLKNAVSFAYLFDTPDYRTTKYVNNWLSLKLMLFCQQTFVFLVFWYQLYCGFSAMVMIDQLHLMAYNLMFTALPPIVMGEWNFLYNIVYNCVHLQLFNVYSRYRTNICCVRKL